MNTLKGTFFHHFCWVPLQRTQKTVSSKKQHISNPKRNLGSLRFLYGHLVEIRNFFFFLFFYFHAFVEFNVGVWCELPTLFRKLLKRNIMCLGNGFGWRKILLLFSWLPITFFLWALWESDKYKASFTSHHHHVHNYATIERSRTWKSFSIIQQWPFSFEPMLPHPLPKPTHHLI